MWPTWTTPRRVAAVVFGSADTVSVPMPLVSRTTRSAPFTLSHGAPADKICEQGLMNTLAAGKRPVDSITIFGSINDPELKYEMLIGQRGGCVTRTNIPETSIT